MALRIYSSNHIETLQQSLSAIQKNQPLENPFSPEVIVTPTYAMARWLNLQLARDLGVAANIQYLRPSQWFWQLAKQYLPELSEEDVYSRQTMSWQLYACLQSLPEKPAFDSIRQYCASDITGLKRWQLAERLADCFERYQWYRPEMIEDWSSGEDHEWQAGLWRQITGKLGPHHRPYQIRSLLETLANKTVESAAGSRFSLFAPSDLPPLYLSVIEALAQHNQLDLYIHSPTDQYWADLQSQKRLGRQRLENPDQADLFETGNELLSAWGRQGQIFQDLLLQADIAESLDVTLYQPPPGSSLLHKIQASIFDIAQPRQAITIDNSISVHVCHSPMRECQVLQDQLLDLLNNNHDLQPEDILVMIPNISAYAASIESVFRYQNIHGLSCNLSDLSLSHEHPSVVSFLQLVSLADSRFTRSDILGLLDNPTIRFQFGIDTEGHQTIVEFINKARVKWGIDGLHKTAFDLPATSENTWAQARNRFFASYAFAGNGLWQDIALLPSEDVNGNQQIGRFWYFFDQLCDWRDKLKAERSASEWRLLLNELLTQFLGDLESSSGSLQQIREGISACLPDGDMTLSPRLVQQLLEQQLYRVEQPGQLYSGGITFCGLRPMRNIPFKVICLLGMNHDEFPRIDRPADFDLITHNPQGGDPSYRMQDRYLMLETLLCCRERLYLSYTGRNLKDNSELPASTLVNELLDYINEHFFDDVDPGKNVVEQIFHLHPMQAYSPRQFSQEQFSYHSYWFEVGQQVAEHNSIQQKPWPNEKVSNIDNTEIVYVEDLRRFLQDPLRYFFAEILGVWLFTEEPESDEETFELDGLDKWQLRQQLAHNHLQQVDNSLALMRAEGRLPHGAAASSSFHKIASDAAEWLTQFDDYRGLAKQSRLIDLSLIGDCRVQGRVGNYYAGLGLLSICAGQLKGKHLLSCWLDHLLLSATNQLPASESSRLIAIDQAIQFKPLDKDLALQHLDSYYQLFCEGRQRPLPVFPKTSFLWAQQDDTEAATKKVWGEWLNQFPANVKGDADDPYIELVLRDIGNPPFDQPEFGELATQLYGAALHHGAQHD